MIPAYSRLLTRGRPQGKAGEDETNIDVQAWIQLMAACYP